MQRIDGEILFSPHDLINYMQCEFITWMDRRYLDDRSLCPDADDESTKILQQKGIEHEIAYLRAEQGTGKSVADVVSGDDAVERSLIAMREGHDIVYQAVLRHGKFGGVADFLYKKEGASNFGNHYYEVRDTKLAKKSKPEFVIQLCCYADLLRSIQGRLPETVGIALGNGKTDVFRTEDYWFYYTALKKSFLRFVESFNPSEPPDDVRLMTFSRWNSEAERIIAERDALSQVANIRRLQVRRLKDSDISTMAGLAGTDLHFVPKIGVDTFTTLKQQARLQIASRGLSRPKYEVLRPAGEHERKGLALLPPEDPFDVWFDMEGYPHMEGGLEYLFGATHLSEGSARFTDFWAHDRRSEKIAFEQFVDWAYDRWRQSPGMHIYHYASYEASAMRRLMGRHGTREQQIDDLLRNEVFVDLYQIVRHSLIVGEPSYSIKNIEHLYRGTRGGEVATAMDSIVFYERWLADPDGDDWRTSKVLHDIREYNRLDCESTFELTQWLRARQSELGIYYIPKTPRKSDDAEVSTTRNSSAQRNAELAKVMLAESSEPLNQLLAQVLQFHERELKPFWWTLFDRLSMTQEELIQDADCLGGLARTKTPVREFQTTRAKWHYIEYEFDSTQETKLAAGNRCCLSYDFDVKVEIESIDRDRGRVVFKIRAEQPEPISPFGLIPCDMFPAKSLQDAIYAVVSQYRNDGHLPSALRDFLQRNYPRIAGLSEGTDLLSKYNLVEVMINMQNTTLCIQGPPGSGKTTTASQVIAELLKKGFRVGITSNSHKCIEHLLNKCADLATQQGVTVLGAKIGCDSDGKPDINPSIRLFQEKARVFPPDDFNLIGGTCYASCIDLAADAFDYLFVDEAGQMSIANLVAISRSARNIILLGDQMQLEQPVQGFHPGESGMSTLEYYMGTCATIPPERGVFLGTTHRMHPNVCSLISNAVYEGKLHSTSDTESRTLIIPNGSNYITKQSGILFVPVEHDGNTQGSEEEAQAIRDIVAELEICEWTNGRRSRRLTRDDVLIVAPYNYQVRLIREYVHGVRVGSVDKFQGQEAPVVILSMAASDANASPRGLNFLFNKNRLNVAISRAMSLAIVVASPRLASTECTSMEQIAMANFFCRIIDEGSSVQCEVADV